MTTKLCFSFEEHIYTQNFFMKKEAESFAHVLPHCQEKKKGWDPWLKNNKQTNKQIYI